MANDSSPDLLTDPAPAARPNVIELERGPLVIPVVAEQLDVDRRVVERGRVVVTKQVEERVEHLALDPLWRDDVDVQRVKKGDFVETPPAPRYEGDTLVLPVVEEVLVVEKRLRLREEVRITRRQTQVPFAAQDIPLRAETIRVERRDGERPPSDVAPPEEGPRGPSHTTHLPPARAGRTGLGSSCLHSNRTGIPMANSDMIDSSRNPNLAPRSARRPGAGQPPVATPRRDDQPISQRLDHNLNQEATHLQTSQRPDQTRPLDQHLTQQRIDQKLDTRVDQRLIDQQRLEANRMQEQRIPIVEESLQVGKREVERGGVRVQSKIVERPVDESVSLREEHVRVERKPVNRPVEPGDMTAFREGTIEVIERAEEAVVAKNARVVEEVIVGKEIGQKTENIHDTLRHTEVSIDRLGGELKTTAFKPFETFDADFRQDYETNYARLGGDYSRYAPLYRYGYNLATARQFAGKDWPAIEAEAQNAWEEQNPGTWEQVKRAVRHGWDRVTGKI